METQRNKKQKKMSRLLRENVTRCRKAEAENLQPPVFCLLQYQLLFSIFLLFKVVSVDAIRRKGVESQGYETYIEYKRGARE